MNDNEIGEEVLACARYGELEELRDFLEDVKTEFGDDMTRFSKILNYKDSGSSNALHKAAANGHSEMCGFLVSQGVQFFPNKSGNTPLHWAIQNKQTETAKVFLSGDCPLTTVDVLAKNENGKSCITFAYNAGDEEVLEMVLQHKSADLLTPPEDKSNEESESSKVTKMEHKIRFNDQDKIDSPSEFFQKVNETTFHVSEVGTGIVDSEESCETEENLKFTGTALWASSVLLSRWIVDIIEEDRNIYEGKSVLELGAGCGLPGLVISAFGNTKSVFITDLNQSTTGDDISYSNLRSNIEVNNKLHSANAKIAALDWKDQVTVSQLVELNDGKKIDVLIGSDLIYRLELVAPLIETILAVLQDDGVFYYVTTESNRAGFKEFVSGLKLAHFNVSKKKAPKRYIESFLSWFSTDVGKDIIDIHFRELRSEQFSLYMFKRMI